MFISSVLYLYRLLEPFLKTYAEVGGDKLPVVEKREYGGRGGGSLCLLQCLQFDYFQRDSFALGYICQRTEDVVFCVRAAVGEVNDQPVFLLAVPTFRAGLERGLGRIGHQFQNQQAETVGEFFHRLETLAQKPFGVAHEVEFGCTRYGDQSCFSLRPGIVDGGLQQRLAVSASLVLSGYPETVDHQIAGGVDGNPGLFGGDVFDEYLGTFVEAAEYVSVVEFFPEPFFFQLIAFLAFFVGEGATNMFRSDVFFCQGDVYFRFSFFIL